MITGANRGIGLALAKLYAGRGDRVIATARDPGAASQLRAVAGPAGAVAVHALDVTDEAGTAALARTLGESAVDLVIANAGVIGARGGLDDPGHDTAAWTETLLVNVMGAYFTARAFLPHLKRSRRGRIAIISSQMGSSTLARGNAYPYRAAKAASANLAFNLAVELKPAGIAVGAYHPGWVQTDMGGAAADIPATTSAAGLVARFDALALATTGVFETYAGKPMPA